MKRLLSRRAVVAAAALVLMGCGDVARAPRPTLAILTAGALARPLRAAADSFARREPVTVELEAAGSVEAARRITELGRTPDVVALADTALFSALLTGRLAAPPTPLATTRMVLAYTASSRGADSIDAANWFRVLQRPGIEVGRSDPSLDPAGYRALLVPQLAERFYRIPGLADSIVSHESPRNVRPKSADLVALLQTGNLDYAWEYESVARAARLRYVRLPSAIDLGDVALASQYAAAVVHVPRPGHAPLVVRGAPIVFGIAPLAAARAGGRGARFITFLGSPAGRRILAGYALTPLNALDARDSADTH